MDNQIDETVESANQIIQSIMQAILVGIKSSAQGVEQQMKLASAQVNLESTQRMIEYILKRKLEQQAMLNEAGLDPTIRALIAYKIEMLDQELSALLRSSGVEEKVVSQAVKKVSARPRASNGRFIAHERNGSI